ncbi:MAG: sigma-70 family RNA polymerase sigma factor [Ignavibacteria bacterium]
MGETTTEAVVKYTPMIRALAARLAAKFSDSGMVDDLIQEGVIALIVAVRQSKEKGERFTAYAYQRIQGAMLDSLRAMDNAPRGLRRETRRTNATVAALEQRLGRRPFESEIAAAVGMQLSDYQKLLFDVYACRLLYFDPMDEQYAAIFDVIDERAEPERQRSRGELLAAIEWAVDALPDAQNRLMSAIYREGRSARQVSEALVLSEGRISQLRKEALEKIRLELQRRGFMPEA